MDTFGVVIEISTQAFDFILCNQY